MISLKIAFGRKPSHRNIYISLLLSFQVLFVCFPDDVLSLHMANVPKPPASSMSSVMDSMVKVSSLIFIFCSLSAQVTPLIACRQRISKTSRDCIS